MNIAVIPYTVCNVDIELKAEYTYTPGCPASVNDIDGGYPEEGAEVGVHNLWWDIYGHWDQVPAKFRDDIIGDNYVYEKLCEAAEKREDA